MNDEKGTDADLGEEFLELMDFFNGELVATGIAKELQDEVDNIKRKEEWRADYMTMMELERERYREGLELGMEQAKERYREGLELGMEQGIRYSFKQALKYGASKQAVIEDIMIEYNMTEEQVKAILDKE